MRWVVVAMMKGVNALRQVDNEIKENCSSSSSSSAGCWKSFYAAQSMWGYRIYGLMFLQDFLVGYCTF
jgi:hypothetical protein